MDADEVVRLILIGLPSVLIAYWGYRRSKKVDAVAAQSGVATETRAGVEQVIDALNELNDKLQADNRNFRETVQQQVKRVSDLEQDNRACWEKTQLLTLRIDVLEKERDDLQRTLDRLIAKYGGDAA